MIWLVVGGPGLSWPRFSTVCVSRDIPSTKQFTSSSGPDPDSTQVRALCFPITQTEYKEGDSNDIMTPGTPAQPG